MSARGHWIWYELLTSDVESALNFYGAVIGWRGREHEVVPGYRMFAAGDADIGGMMASEPQLGLSGPVWIGYVSVEDVDATAAAAQRDGATICVPPTSYPGVGRFSMLQDPQGAPVYAMRPGMEGGVSRSFAAEVGHCQWNELVTSDPSAAAEFYMRTFGWEKGDVMPMGPAGDYQFMHDAGGRFGAIMKRTREGAHPIWRFYFGVADIDRAADSIVAGGGRLVQAPVEIPGGGFSAVAIDPQGAEFGIAGPRVR